ncbi:MAG: S8 family serine peptidase, partial [Bacteroidota bacterium]
MLGSLFASTLLAPALVAAPQEVQAATPAPAQAPGAYVEIPGELEFTGVLCARPLQAGSRAAAGLSPRERQQRVARGLQMLAELELREYVADTDEYLIEVPDGETENTISALLMQTGGFQYVEPDWLVYPVQCPNDPRFNQQWHHQSNRIQSCDAWDIETGDPSIVVAICDTGIRLTHEDLQLHRYEGYHAPSQTWESSGGPIDDINGHGTLCSGTAAANGDNGVGVAGVGWNLGHRTMRVTDNTDGTAPISFLTNAARTAVLAGDRVSSVSYGGGTGNSVNTAGAFIRSNGGLLVWAAGNASQVLGGSREDDVILVGSTNESDGLSGFSNRGSRVDLTAPGSAIRTTSRNSDSSYSAVSGTSFACPMTAGLCGLIWSRNPDLTPAQVEQILRDSCEDLGGTGVDDTFGYGRINAFQAMQLTPSPLVEIDFLAGRPDVLLPQGGDTVTVRVGPAADAVDPSGVLFFVDTGAGFVPSQPAVTGGPVFEFTGVFPPADCPSEVRYYFEFPLVGGAVAS